MLIVNRLDTDDEAVIITKVVKLYNLDTITRLEMGYLLRELKKRCTNWSAFCKDNLPMQVRSADRHIKAFEVALKDGLVELETKVVAETIVETKVVAETNKPLPSMTALANSDRAIKAKATREANLRKEILFEQEFQDDIENRGLETTWVNNGYYNKNEMQTIMELDVKQIHEADRLIESAHQVIEDAIAKVKEIAGAIEDEVEIDLLHDLLGSLGGLR